MNTHGVHMTRAVDDERWQRFIARNDVPCPLCAYNLRGLESERCPECGAMVDPDSLMFVGVDEPILRGVAERFGAWGAIGAAALLHVVGRLIAPVVYGFDRSATPETANIAHMLDTAVTVPLLLVALVLGWSSVRGHYVRSAYGSDWLQDVAARFDQRAWRVCWVLVGVKAAELALVVMVALTGS